MLNESLGSLSGTNENSLAFVEAHRLWSGDAHRSSQTLALGGVDRYIPGKMKRALRCAFFTALLVFTVLLAGAQTSSIIVPKEAANSFGNTYGALFALGGFAQLYDAAEFTEIPSDVIEISAIGFRWDESQNGPIDASVPDIRLWMGVSTNEGGYAFARYVQNVKPVFEAKSAKFTGTENRAASSFDLVFPLDHPFVYDRRLGRLIVQAIVSTVRFKVDGEASERSYVVSGRSTDQEPDGAPSVMVTQFHYRILPVIDSIRRVADLVEIDVIYASDRNVILEAGLNAAGPFLPDANAKFAETATGRSRTAVYITDERRFFRVRTN